MAITQNTFTGNGSNLGPFSFTFKWLEPTDIKVTVGGVLKTAGTHYNLQSLNYTTKDGGQVLFTAGNAPANGASIRVYRDTDDSALSATFYPGSAIRSQDLNDNFTQNLYVTQEVNNNAVSIDGSNPMAGNLNVNNFKVVNLATPTVSTDASTKGYVDSVVATGAANAAAAAASASAAASSATAAANSLDTFDDRYLGTKASDPAVDNDGSALITGAMYFNTTTNRTRIYNGTLWIDAGVPGSLVRWTKTAAGGQTSLSGNDNNSNSLNYTPGSEQVFLNGALLTRGVDYTATTGTTITGLVALTAGDVVDVLSLNQYVVGTVPDQSVTNAKVATAAGIAASKLSFTQAGTGAVARTVDSKLADVVSVKDFGAVGDGVTNDTAAIQAALNSGAKNVTLPIGTFLSGLLTLPTGVSLYGEGGVLKAITNTFFQIVIPVNSSYSTIQGITFDATNLVPGSSIAPYPTGEASCIATGSTTVGTIKDLKITDCRFLSIPRNYATNPQRVHSIILGYGEATVTNCYTEQCGGDIYNFNAGQFIVSNCVAKDSGDGGIAFNNGARGTIADNYIFKCDLGIGSGHQGTTASPDNSFVVSGNEIVACGDGINMGWFGYAGKTAPRHVKVANNTIRNCKRAAIRYDGQPDASWDAFILIDSNSIYNSGSTDFDGNLGTGFGFISGYMGNSIVSDNAFFNNRGTDLTLYGPSNTVTGNIIDGGSYSGTGLTGLDHSGDDQLITGNVFDGKHFLLQNSTGSVINTNTFKNVPGVAAGQGSLVVAATASNATISDNYFDTNGNGIHFANSATWFLNDVLFTNRFNNCTNKAVNSPLTTQYGSFYEQVTFTGTCNASGQLVISHGTGANGKYIASALGFYKGNSGESLPMSLSFIDGGNIVFTGGVSGRAARACVTYDKDFGTW
jgi:hypothetical protein